MAQRQKAAVTQDAEMTRRSKRRLPSSPTHQRDAAQAETRPKDATEDVVIFTSHDGTVREVGALPANLARATALANEKAVSKVWGTPEEDAACHAMQKGI